MNQRLIAAKQSWAEKQKARGRVRRDAPAEGRLPPGQRLVKAGEFPVLDLGVKPEIPTSDWKLRIDGAVEAPTVLDWAGLHALEQVEDVSDFHCVTTWSKFDCRWGGVAFTTLAELVRVKPEARFVFFTSYDGYTTNVPLDQCLDDDVLLATSFEGGQIDRDHGGPARIIIPKLYAWKGAKWIRHIHFMEGDRLGFWEVRGYSNTADPFTEDRYA